MNANQGGAPQGQKPGRPGAMTMAMQAVQVKPTGPKVLRIGLIQGGKIIEERIVRTRETVTVGSSERNHFVLSAPQLPPRFELFQLVGSDYILNFTAEMTGRVGLPAGVQDLAQLRSSGAARNAGSHYQVKLNDNSRGKVVLGDTTVLFQFVSPPPVQPRPQLPAAVRGGFAKSIDWMFTAFVVFSFMTHFGFVVYLENADWEIEQGISAIPQKYAKLIFQEPEPPETPPEEEAPSDEEAPAEEKVAKEEKPSKEPAKEPSPSEGPSDAEKKAQVAEATARMAEEASAAAEALLLGALSADGGGALADVLAGGAVTGNAADVLAEAAGVGVATSSSGQLRTRSGGGSGKRTGGLGSLAASQGAGKAVGEGKAVTEKKISGRVNAQGGGDIGGAGDFDVSKVTAMVKRRLRAIQICYEKELRRDPSLKGKVTVEFTIVERGNVSQAKAVENTTGDSNVAKCVVNVIRGFRFNPGPDGGSVTYSYPFVFAPQS